MIVLATYDGPHWATHTSRTRAAVAPAQQVSRVIPKHITALVTTTDAHLLVCRASDSTTTPSLDPPIPSAEYGQLSAVTAALLSDSLRNSLASIACPSIMYSSSDSLDWPSTVGPLDSDSSLNPTVFTLSPFSPLPRSITRLSTSTSTAIKDEDNLFPSLLPSSTSVQPSDHPTSPTLSPHSCNPPSDLLTSLTFSPTQLIAQLVTQATDSPSHAHRSEARKRERLTGLTKQQRAMRKKEQHRLIDAQRRQREQVVVVKMQQLMGCNKQLQHKRQRSDTNSTSTGSNSDSESSSEEREVEEYEEAPRGQRVDKSDRVSVLERAVDHMERMQAALHQMAAACTTQQQQFRSFIERQQFLCATANTCTCNSASSSTSARSCSCCPPSHPLSILHPLMTHQLHTHINGGALDSSSYISASVAMMVVSLTTGCILDVNSRFLTSGGWERHHLVDRNMLAPYAKHAQGGPADTAAKMGLLNDRFLVDGPDGALVPAPLFEQYERSKQLLKQLVLGEQEMVRAVWRTTMRDGRLCELESTAWAGGHVEVEIGSTGERVRRPAYVVFVSSIESRVFVRTTSDKEDIVA